MRQCAAVCGRQCVAVCGSVWQYAWQCVAVRLVLPTPEVKWGARGGGSYLLLRSNGRPGGGGVC
jgi:hypothetical protein